MCVCACPVLCACVYCCIYMEGRAPPKLPPNPSFSPSSSSGGTRPGCTTPLSTHLTSAPSANACSHDTTSPDAHSSSAALATSSFTTAPAKSLAASSHPLLCPMHITVRTLWAPTPPGAPPPFLAPPCPCPCAPTVATMVCLRWHAVTPSMAAKWYRLPRKCVSAASMAPCTLASSRRVSRDLADALHSTRSGEAHPMATRFLPSSAARVRPHTVMGRSWSFRLASSVQLSECRSTIMRRGGRGEEEEASDAGAAARASTAPPMPPPLRGTPWPVTVVFVGKNNLALEETEGCFCFTVPTTRAPLAACCPPRAADEDAEEEAKARHPGVDASARHSIIITLLPCSVARAAVEPNEQVPACLTRRERSKDLRIKSKKEKTNGLSGARCGFQKRTAPRDARTARRRRRGG
mmetsp:Transcript_18997/g.47356  ORF Transcript_18997/g.47356 Transcript_18997/m.47356 type:complete len:408 (-) Transcript_18997:86-1309(-)